MDMSARKRYSNTFGTLGILCIGLFWLALLAPERVDTLLRPYGLYVWFSVLLAAVLLPSIAAVIGSRWWLIVTALAVFALVKYFLGVSS